MVTDKQIDEAWGNANFGYIPKRQVIADALLKFSLGYATGNTIREICKELGLVESKYKLTIPGRDFLYDYWKNTLNQ